MTDTSVPKGSSGGAQCSQDRPWHKAMGERVMQLEAAGAKNLSISVVLGLIGFVRDGEGSPLPAPAQCSQVPDIEELADAAESVLLPEIERLREALEFYADPTRYSGPNSRLEGDPDKYQPDGLYYRLDVTRDGGRLARRALALPSTHCGTLQDAAQRLVDELLAQHIPRDKFSVGIGEKELHAYVRPSRVNCRADIIDGWPVVWHFNIGPAVALSATEGQSHD